MPLMKRTSKSLFVTSLVTICPYSYRKIAELESELKNKSEDLVHLERNRDKVQLRDLL